MCYNSTVMQAPQQFEQKNNFKMKPITPLMGWDRFLSYPVCLTACVRLHASHVAVATMPGSGLEGALAK